MKNKYPQRVLVLTMFLLTVCWTNNVFSQGAGGGERYNLAVYATGLQNDQPLSSSLLTVLQNKTITKLTGEGNYRLIERSNEFLQQIQKEQKTQHSGDVADGQIAELGAGYGAQKVCVVSVTIIDQYLYIATRIVDVATKSSYESGDAEDAGYSSIPVLTKTLDISLDKMLSIAQKTNTANMQSYSKSSSMSEEEHSLPSNNPATFDAEMKKEHVKAEIRTENASEDANFKVNKRQGGAGRNIFLGFNETIGLTMTTPEFGTWYKRSFGIGASLKFGIDFAFPISNKCAIGFYANVSPLTGFIFYDETDYDLGDTWLETTSIIDAKVGLLFLIGDLDTQPFIIGIAPHSGYSYAATSEFFPFEIRLGRVLKNNFYITGNLNIGIPKYTGQDSFMIEPGISFGWHFGDKIKTKK